MPLKYGVGRRDTRRHLIVSQNIHNIIKWHAYNKDIQSNLMVGTHRFAAAHPVYPCNQPLARFYRRQSE